MREIRTVIDTYCDIHNREDNAQVEAIEEITFQLEGKPMRLDVCADHKDPRWSAVLAYAIPDINPAAKPPPPRANGGMSCPVEGCAPKKRIENRQGLMVHISRMHGELPLEVRQQLAGYELSESAQRKAERDRAYKLRRATQMAEHPNRPRTDVCPLEECGKMFNGEQGVRMHLWRAHGVKEPTERDALIGRVASHHGGNSQK
jgi:hypothetical protein